MASLLLLLCSDMDTSFELESTVAEKVNEQYREILKNKPSTYSVLILSLCPFVINVRITIFCTYRYLLTQICSSSV